MKLPRIPSLFLVVAFALFSVSSVQAALITYAESASGDLDGTQMFTIDMAGVHTWSGTSSLSIDFAQILSIDVDSFDINLAAGLVIVGVSGEFSNMVAVGPFTELSVGPLIDDGSSILFRDLTAIVGTASPFISSLPLSSGTYTVGESGKAGCSLVSDTCDASWDWTISINVVAVSVPEPSTVFLLGAGLFGVVGYARRRR